MKHFPRAAAARRWSVHGSRVAVFVAIVLLIHARYRALVAKSGASGPPPIPLQRVREFFPTAESLRASAIVAGGFDVRGARGGRIGTVLETAPNSDSTIGFSGSTNLLVALDSAGRIAGLAVLSSGDTPQHVARVRNDPKFFRGYIGLTLDEAARRVSVDAVSGATLTSFAMAEGLRRRLGGAAGASLKFPAAVTVGDVRSLFPHAEQIESDPGDPSVARVRGRKDAPLGWVLRTSPAADNTIGYQGPTDALVGIDLQGRVVGLAIHQSYDNEPYVGYVRDDEEFRNLFDGKSIEALAGLDLEAAGVEGVSGATMTSMAVAKGLVLAAKGKLVQEQASRRSQSRGLSFAPADVGTLVVVLAGIVIGFTKLRGIATVRVGFQFLVLAYLGLVNGVLLSQAQLLGWAQSGVPAGAWSLILLTAAALLLPIMTKRNLYCSHLCPHGALQQLALRFAHPRHTIPRPWRTAIGLVPGGLLLFCLLVSLAHWPFNLADIEPFDAYVFRIAGWGTLAIAAVGGVASLFVPMAYCRYGCPTGALLNYLRGNARSGRFTRRDLLAGACLALAALFWWVGK
ncbi:MAG TPA: FMN-binding protein [Pirellulales bacterium]|jgi:Na+-translocating ferredoxin:NAD+ oxidoreductase RnfG subunit|nr:FMN-binding protein [Pirellulales bacterium]